MGNHPKLKLTVLGKLTYPHISKKTVTLNLKGATNVDLVALQNKRDNNISGLINGAVLEDIDNLGYVIPKALLTRVTPSVLILGND